MIHSLSSSFRLKCTILGMVLRSLPQPKPHFPLTYGLHILGAVRGKKYCELVEYEVHTSTESVCLRENVTILMKFIQQHLQQGFLQEFTEHSFSAGNFSRNHMKNQDFQSKIEILRSIVVQEGIAWPNACDKLILTHPPTKKNCYVLTFHDNS